MMFEGLDSPPTVIPDPDRQRRTAKARRIVFAIMVSFGVLLAIEVVVFAVSQLGSSPDTTTSVQ